jgi:3-phenylpropionate/trans-cinnamate dioxygenase ferredoxin subunit
MNLIASAQAFHPVSTVNELEIDVPTSVEVPGRQICVLRLSDEVIAFEDRCPHRGHPLSEGKCIDGNLRCALHGWEFSLPDGRASSPRAPFGLDLIETRIVDGSVEVLA